MSFYQNVNEIEDDILKIEPITWGNFQILGLQENFPKDDPVFYSFYRSRNESWHNLIRGILTNDINLVRDNVNKVDILGVAQVVTNDPNNRVKFFSVQEAKKYSNDEIINYLRKIYDEKCLNVEGFCSQKAITSRGSFFTMVPSFDGEQPAKIRPNRVKMLKTPILLDKIRAIGVPIYVSNPTDDYEDSMNLQLSLAVFSGNLEAVKDITQSHFNVSTIQPVITENFNELFLDLVYEAKRLGFYEIARCLRAVEIAQGKYSELSFSELQKQQESGLKLGEFVKLDIPMEEE